MKQIGFIGCGNMGSALIESMAHNKEETLFLYDIDSERAHALAKRTNSVAVELDQLLQKSQIIFLGLKPDTLPSLFPTLKEYDKRWISMAAGTSLKTLSRELKSDQVIRIMPTIAASVGKATIALASTKECDQEFIQRATILLQRSGVVYPLDESLFSAFTAIAGSAIATVFTFLDALALGAVREGFSYEKALEIIIKMNEGASSLLEKSKLHPQELVKRICSPKGTTIESIRLLHEHNFTSTLIDSVRAASQRSDELERG